MKLLYGPVGAALFVAVLVLVSVAVIVVYAALLAHVAPDTVHHTIIHTGIGRVLCAPGFCDREY